MFLLTNISFDWSWRNMFSHIFFFHCNLFCVDLKKNNNLIATYAFFSLKSLFWFQIYSIWLNNKGAKFSPYPCPMQ